MSIVWKELKWDLLLTKPDLLYFLKILDFIITHNAPITECGDFFNLNNIAVAST